MEPSTARQVRLIVIVLVLACGIAAVIHATVGSGDSSASTSHTQKKILRPVHPNGTPVHGWTVDTYGTDTAVHCTGPAPSSVNKDVAQCHDDTAYLPACWRSTDHTALCLSDPHQHRLRRISYDGEFPTGAAVAHPTPIGLNLAVFGRCAVRFGGTWAKSVAHPSWNGFYFCNSAAKGESRVYSPAGRPDGIDHSQSPWKVAIRTAAPTEKFTTDEVRTALYVGTYGLN